MTFPLEFSMSETGGQRTLQVKGEIDLSVCTAFEQKLVDAVAATPPGGDLVADLSGVRFFDVNALHAFLCGARAARAARVRLRLAASPAVDRLFALLEIDAERLPGEAHQAPLAPRLWTTVPPAGHYVPAPSERAQELSAQMS